MNTATGRGSVPPIAESEGDEEQLSQTSFRIPNRIRARLDQLASTERRSLTQQTVLVLEAGLTALDAQRSPAEAATG